MRARRRGRQSFAAASAWSYVLAGVRLGGNLVVALVLAGILGPEAFGIVALAAALVALLELFARQGLEAAIVQRPELAPRHLDTAFWMALVAVGLLAPLLWASSAWYADATDVPQLRSVVLGLSPLVLLRGLAVVPTALLRREMQFRLLAGRTSAAVVAGGVVGVVAALAGAGVWSLVAQQVVAAAVEVLAVWALSPWRPGLRLEGRACRELLGFSSASAVASLGVFAATRSDAVLIGFFFGPLVVGLYRLCTRFVDVVLELTAGAVQAVLLAELSRTADDPVAFRRRSEEVIGSTTALAIPAIAALAAVAEPLLALVGTRWAVAADGLRVLCLLGVAQAVSSMVGPILQAGGRPGLVAVLTWGSAAANAVAFVVVGALAADLTASDQMVWLAVGRLAALAPVLLVAVPHLLRRVAGVPPAGLARAVAVPTAAGLVAVVVPATVRAVAGGWPRQVAADLLLTGALSSAAALAVLLRASPPVQSLVAGLGHPLRRAAVDDDARAPAPR